MPGESGRVLSSLRRRKNFSPPRRLTSVAVMGLESTLNLRSARQSSHFSITATKRRDGALMPFPQSLHCWYVIHGTIRISKVMVGISLFEVGQRALAFGFGFGLGFGDCATRRMNRQE